MRSKKFIKFDMPETKYDDVMLSNFIRQDDISNTLALAHHSQFNVYSIRMSIHFVSLSSLFPLFINLLQRILQDC